MPADRTTKCGNCGTRLDESSSLPAEQRIPCPKCGSLARAFELSVEPGHVRIVGSPLGGELRRLFYEYSVWRLLVVAALSFVSGIVGAFLIHEWWSLGTSLAFSGTSFFVGLSAVIRTREIVKFQP